MTIVQQYKKKMIETIETIYNGKIDHDWIVNYVNRITKEAENTQLLAHCRNLYKYQFHFIRDPNFIPNEIEDKHLNILANGLYTENFNPAVFKILNEWMDERSKYKKKMLACKNAGDMDGYREYNAKQNKKKANTNAIYGASTMSKGWISNIDMGGAITAQARNFISEQVWCIERFLGSNYAFYNINEIFAFITKLFEIKKKIFTPEVLSLLDYIPTPDDCRKRFIQITMDVPRLRKDLKNMQQSVFLMFEMMEDWKRVAFYYANNPLELIAKNQKMFNNMKTFIDMDVEFINPYEIPEEMNAPMKEFFYYMQTFCYASIIVSERVLKYQTKFRKVCVIGDTDSTMPSLLEMICINISDVSSATDDDNNPANKNFYQKTGFKIRRVSGTDLITFDRGIMHANLKFDELFLNEHFDPIVAKLNEIAICDVYLKGIKSGHEYHGTIYQLNKIMSGILGNKITIKRFKGLGDVSCEDLVETVINPTTRSITRVSINEAEKADGGTS